MNPPPRVMPDLMNAPQTRGWRVAFATCLLYCVLMLALSLPASTQAQTRLEQMEATYQANLRTLHAPVIQEYLRQLELLKSRFTAANRVTDVQQVDAEISRVKQIAATTGVLPYVELEAALMPEPSSPAPATPGAEVPVAKAPLPKLPSWLAAEATQGPEISGKTGAIPLGSAEWRVNKLAAGTYDVLILFACEKLLLPEQVTVTLGGPEFKGSVSTERATGSPETFRLLKLCQVKLDTEVTGGVLTLAADSQDQSRLWVKKVMLALPKKAAAPPPASLVPPSN